MAQSENRVEPGLHRRVSPGARGAVIAACAVGPAAAVGLVGLDTFAAGAIDPVLAGAGLGFVVVAGLVATAALRRLRGVHAVADAVRAAAAGERGQGELTVDPGAGPIAQAWNQLAAGLSGPGAERGGLRAQGLELAVTALESLHDGVIVLDRKGQAALSNASAGVLLSMERDLLSEAALREFLGRDGCVQLDEALSGRAMRTATIDRGGRGDASQQVRVRVSPVGEQRAHRLVVLTDVTRQAAAEAARAGFLAQATHELRAPLSNIKLYVEQAIDEGDRDPGLRVEALNVVANESQRLERIVSSLLSIAELESGARRAEMGDVRIEQMLDDVRQSFEAQAREKGLALSFQQPPKMPVLRGDRDQIMMLIQNLVGNAIKYTPEGGSVAVRAGVDETSFMLDVIDTGIGITPAEAPLVFEKFFRSHDERIRGIEGSGLGLAFSREVARRHGGDITLDSELNRGSTFTLRLPIRAAA
jgi:two-component system sensor histidine kinase VicK